MIGASLRFGIAFACAATVASAAEAFERVDEKALFLELVKERDLKRFAINLQVTEEGQITGKAFGMNVTGAWEWKDGYFCRDLYVGGDELGANCQMVEIRRDKMRFTSDRGEGIYADFRLE